MEHLIWVDIETTDLEPDKGSILELGLAATTPELEIIHERSWIFAFNKTGLSEVSDWSLKQHFLSGLLPLNLVSDNSAGEIQDDALRTLKNWTGDAIERSPMCGSTVHFDRGWLKVHMPQLEAWFHYRNIDVSTVKNLARLWHPTLKEFHGMGVHRAVPDLRDSINELRYYVEQGVVDGPGTFAYKEPVTA